MTEKLFYVDSGLYDFEAVVKDIRTVDGKTAVVLDKSAFFPEGGGQPGDKGKIADAEVYDTREIDGEILHFVNETAGLKIGDTAACSLDRVLRFTRMQSHSGEHIVSGVAYRRYGAQNVGFHMIDEVMTVDLDRPLDKEQVALIEREANEWVWRNVKITAEFVSADKLNTLQYRSKLELKENVRIVTIDGCDSCACCAPHVSCTGQIGVIKVLTCVSHRGGVRLTLVCGAKAYEDYYRKHTDIMCISAMLKAPNAEVTDAVAELSAKTEHEKNNTICLKQKLYHYIFDSITRNENNIVLFVDDFSPEELRELADLCKAKAGKVFAVFSGNEKDGYAFAVASRAVKLRALSSTLNNELNARGGGRDEMLQGRADTVKETILRFFDDSEVWKL